MKTFKVTLGDDPWGELIPVLHKLGFLTIVSLNRDIQPVHVLGNMEVVDMVGGRFYAVVEV